MTSLMDLQGYLRDCKLCPRTVSTLSVYGQPYSSAVLFLSFFLCLHSWPVGQSYSEQVWKVRLPAGEEECEIFLVFFWIGHCPLLVFPFDCGVSRSWERRLGRVP